VDLGATVAGRWLFVKVGTAVERPHGRGYNHPCDAVALIPSGCLWTATWLAGWDPTLHVDLAQVTRNEAGHVRTVDLDVDVVRHRDGRVATLDLDEFDENRRMLEYPTPLIESVIAEERRLAHALRRRDPPFGAIPAFPESSSTVEPP
jgi:hypothetical protein